jgi:CTD small phosphatase-like protein 2
LVLDLDETLVHFDEKNSELAIRPYAIEFLDQMSQYFEVVIFTAGMQDYAEWAI